MLFVFGGENRLAGQWQRQYPLLGRRQKKRQNWIYTTRNGKSVCQIRPGCIDYTVGEVEEFDGTVDGSEAQGDEGVDGTCDDAVK